MHLAIADRVASRVNSTSSNTSTSSTSSPSLSTLTSAASSKTSSIARAFTLSVKNKEKDSAMGRSSSQRAPIRPSQISLPVALVSTTNMLSYDAPDVAQVLSKRRQERQQQNSQPQPSNDVPRKASTSSAATSDSGSLNSRHSNASHTTAATSLSVEAFSPESPEPNHLSCYFKQNSARTQAQVSPVSPASNRLSESSHIVSRVDSPMSSQNHSPLIPSRATSHSMKAHVLSHKRSVSRNVSANLQTAKSESDLESETEKQQTLASTSIASSHPFGKELEQLNQIAEEFSSSIRDAEQSADFGVLQSKGLGNFCATEYMQEIAPLFDRAYGRDLASSTPAWI